MKYLRQPKRFMVANSCATMFPATRFCCLCVLATFTMAADIKQNMYVNEENTDDLMYKEQDGLMDAEDVPPDILIVIFASERQYFLPYLLGAVERFDYPKEHLSLWVHEEVPVEELGGGDDNKQKSAVYSQQWFEHFRSLYHSASVSTKGKDDGDDGARLLRHNELHEAALALGRDLRAAAILFLDANCILFEPGLLRDLQLLDGDIVAPLLASYTRYTNYWCAMNDNGNYMLTDACENNRKFVDQGEVHVASVHSCYMVKSEKALKLMTYRVSTVSGLSKSAEMNAANSSVSLLGLLARRLDLKIVVSNKRLYGYMIPPLNAESTGLRSAEEQDWDQLSLLQLYFYTKDRYDLVRPSAVMPARKGNADHYGKGGRALRLPSKQYGLAEIDKVFVINLDRREDRMKRMQESLAALGIRYSRLAAVDGRSLTDDQLKSMGISLLSGYRDPHRKRPMTRGEIGCFMSHYNIWQQVAAADASITSVLVLEDDIRFVPYFATKLDLLLNDTRRVLLDWDFIYIGRKRMVNANEVNVRGSIRIVHVDYSYWTLGYLITPRGAQKLLDAQPLEKLVPVDEFLPIMFDRHPEAAWAAHFHVRNLSAFSAAPLLVEPLYYTGEAEYVSDTEDSTIVGGVYLDGGGQMPTLKFPASDVKDDAEGDAVDSGYEADINDQLDEIYDPVSSHTEL